MGALRGRSRVVSMNTLRESSIYSNASSIEYAACMEAQNKNSNWANQTEVELFELFYISPKGGETSIQVSADNKTSKSIPYVGLASNTFPQMHASNFDLLLLPYIEL